VKLICNATGLTIEVADDAAARYIGRGFHAADTQKAPAKSAGATGLNFNGMTNAEIKAYIKEHGGTLPEKINKAMLIAVAEAL